MRSCSKRDWEPRSAIRRWRPALEHLAKTYGADFEEVQKQLAAYDLKLEDWRLGGR